MDANGRVLLGRRASDPGRGLWDIPGGFLEEQEDPISGLRREFLEETGLAVEPEDFLGIWVEGYGERFVFCATWLVRPIGGNQAPGDDLAHLEWFTSETLPSASDFAFSTHVEILSLWVARSGVVKSH